MYKYRATSYVSNKHKKTFRQITSAKMKDKKTTKREVYPAVNTVYY